MKPRLIHFLALILCLPLFSCGTNESKQVDVDAIRTEAVSTFASSLTETLAPRPTASFTPTSLPTFTPAVLTQTAAADGGSENSCYDLLWIEDRTIPDGTRMKANESFTKTWLVQNNGGCAWAPGFTFSHVGGDPMRGKTVLLKEPIPVGAKREVSVELVVPGGQSGLVQGSWRMADASGKYFGDTLSVNIIVGEAPTPPATTPP